MEPAHILLVGAGAFLAGGMNALVAAAPFFLPRPACRRRAAGDGNASNTVGLCPASLVSAWAYRREALRHGRWAALRGRFACLRASAAAFTLATSNAAFARLIPGCCSSPPPFSPSAAGFRSWCAGPRAGWGDPGRRNPGGPA